MINGMDSLSLKIVPPVHNATVARQTDLEDLPNAKAETADAQGRAAFTIMTSITRAEELLHAETYGKQCEVYRK